MIEFTHFMFLLESTFCENMLLLAQTVSVNEPSVENVDLLQDMQATNKKIIQTRV